MTTRLRHATTLLLAVLLASSGALAGCKKKKREFVPLPRVNADAVDGDGGAAGATPDGGTEVAVASGDGGAGAATGSGDGDGGATGPEVSGDLSQGDANALLTFLDVELKAGIDSKSLFTALARKCSTVGQCGDPPCRAVLATCSGDSVAACGASLQASCPAFNAQAQGLSGEELATRTETWLRDLWGDLIVKLRLSLPEKLQGKVDTVAERHQL